MEWWQILLIAIGSAALLLVLAAFFLWRSASARMRALAGRVQRLPWRAKLSLARSMFEDDRVPMLVRVIPVLLILYLSMPLDILPDFIPVVGQIDDVLVVAVGAGLMLRLTPVTVLEQHISSLERSSSPRAQP
jgi:uncharacterized membrane protein YkvA (DUF1232 family)